MHGECIDNVSNKLRMWTARRYTKEGRKKERKKEITGNSIADLGNVIKHWWDVSYVCNKLLASESLNPKLWWFRQNKISSTKTKVIPSPFLNINDTSYMQNSDCLRLSLCDQFRNLNIGYIRRPLTVSNHTRSVSDSFHPSLILLLAQTFIAIPNPHSPIICIVFHTLWQIVSSFGILYKWNKNVTSVSQNYRCSQKMPTLQMAHSIMHYIKSCTFLIGLDKLRSGPVLHFSCYLQSD
jgi:hypothetical protein